MNILVTGGCGFIGSHFVKYWLETYPKDLVVILDLLTYAGKIENLKGAQVNNNLEMVQGDICDRRLVSGIFKKFDFDYVVNFAAESHVDNSIKDAQRFIQSNIVGVATLLDVVKEEWKGKAHKRFLQISTDEVYGSLNRDEERFTETTPLNPSSPYSASKTSADLLVLAYHKTFGVSVLVTRCSNNFGSNQDTEKLIPLMITNALKEVELPVYGDGQNIRDWIYVKDHCEAIDCVLRKGRIGEVYNVGGNNEKTNLEIINKILILTKRSPSLIKFVQDRLGHDKRYAVNTTKIEQELGWKAKTDFREALKETVEWYRTNER